MEETLGEMEGVEEWLGVMEEEGVWEEVGLGEGRGKHCCSCTRGGSAEAAPLL